MGSLLPLRRALLSQRAAVHRPLTLQSAQACWVHRTAVLHRPYKDDQDRESLKPKVAEDTRSGTNDEVASMDDAAFNPAKTRPEQAKETAGRETGSGTNPLEFSGANKDMASATADPVPAQDGKKNKGQISAGSGQKSGKAAP